jgi:putative addiction module component (TIGR02574 family)
MSHELREELLELSVAERLELVQELWDSMAADREREPYPLTDEQRHDLERRLAEADLSDVFAWYEERLPGLGAVFLRSLDACLARIERHPEAQPRVR